MATYFFHLDDGTDVLLDPEGQDLRDIDAVRAIALIEARALIAEDVREGRVQLDRILRVEDSAGGPVYRLPFADAVHIIWPDRPRWKPVIASSRR